MLPSRMPSRSRKRKDLRDIFPNMETSSSLLCDSFSPSEDFYPLQSIDRTSGNFEDSFFSLDSSRDFTLVESGTKREEESFVMSAQDTSSTTNIIDPDKRPRLPIPAETAIPVSEERTDQVNCDVTKLRNWKLHKGNNRFFCNGRIIMAKQNGVFILTLVLLTITLSLYFVFDAPFLWTEVSPALPLVEAVLAILMFGNLFMTTFSDPGILPRAASDEVAEEERKYYEKIASETIDTENANPSRNTVARTIQVTVNGVVMRLKRCQTCQVYRPPRSSHCSICNNCILNFDHHCPWVGNCVGLRNYRYFYFFLLTLSLLIMSTFGGSLAHLFILTRDEILADALKKSPTSIVVALISFFTFFSISCLSTFHSYLVAKNLTTNEDIKGTYSSKRHPSVRNPYNQGIIANCSSRLCGPHIPSLLNRRGYPSSGVSSDRSIDPSTVSTVGTVTSSFSSTPYTDRV